MRSLFALGFSFAVGLAISCGGQSTTSSGPATPAPSETAPTETAPTATATASASASAPVASASASAALVGPDTVAWKDMTPEQKGRFMKVAVMPKMKEVFQAYDAKAHEKFTCMTCHGERAKTGDFKMPNEKLFVLPSKPDEFGKLMKAKPAAVKFMMEQVKPEMAKLLGMKEFDMKNPQSNTMGCANCHTMKK